MRVSMWTLLSYLGVSPQSELCTWSLLGAVRTTFDATLFHINANLKQVWSMKMPQEISLPVQSVLRAMITGVVLVQCFTVHLYLASYIVLLYPIFLEERPVLVLPWLLVSAIRGLLCELLGLALGLTSCLLVGAARAPCIVFVLCKIANIAPAFYMWMIVFSYYQSLKMLTGFRTFATGTSPAGLTLDYGVELAVRRRKTKSLLTESELRLLVTNRQRVLPLPPPHKDPLSRITNSNEAAKLSIPNNTLLEEVIPSVQLLHDLPAESTPESGEISELGFDEWIISYVTPRRNVDRILDQFVEMILKVSAYINLKKSQDVIQFSQLRFSFNNDQTAAALVPESTDNCLAYEAVTPPHVGSSGQISPSYVREFPGIFNKPMITPISRRLNTWMAENSLASRLVRDDSIQTDAGSVESQSMSSNN